jgi:Mg2+-importing ATPase
LPSRRWLFQLSFAKLFLDQALPSGGISSTAFVSTALEKKGIPRRAAISSAMVSMISYYTGYVVALAAALVFAGVFGRRAALIIVLAVVFLAFSIGLTAAILLLSGRQSPAERKPLRLPVVKDVLSFMEVADPEIIRDPRRLGNATLWQVAICLLDAATIWVLIRSLGASAPADAVFASFMVSSLFRTMAIVPGGLGTYEAASVFTLRMIGLGLPLAFSATLLFRGLSFWLPMLPGLWYSHRVIRTGVHPSGVSGVTR